ncbi:E3 ubiquitin-protein ligase RNF25 isoform X2 [Alosa alosa]|uniref:E3 ubiquitin-protein ligase RNF25 isoform X2 n=1 Tax=Alosa alosa TaxID=278164 RepID=UPI0020151051|nr:E3 ubiquitin-protein ligase RNF25 isoform X2 [Alosa alosa]
MAAENDVHSEIEVLQSIYLDELKVTQRKKGGWEVSLVLYPSTAEDVLSQFVRLTLTLTLAPQYPYIPPVISIHNPRGLSDDKLLSVQRCLQMEAESCPGAPVLYQVIEKAKEILTESNIPHGNCVICLYGFKDGEAFTKTSCYHYFHSHCLGRYVSHSEMELREREREIEEDKSRGRMDGEELAVVCPVCREPLACDVDALLSSPAPVSPETAGAVVGADFRQKWVELKRIWERQRQRGGIIDPEVESNRFLIHINEGPSETCDPTSGTSDLPPTPLETPAPISQPSIPQPSIPQYPGHGSRRCHYGRRGRGHNKGGRRGRGGQVHAGIPEAMPDFTKLSLASEKHNHVRGDTMVLNGTYVDTGSCGDPEEQEVKTTNEGKLVAIKGPESTEAGNSKVCLTSDPVLQPTESTTEDVKAHRQTAPTERPRGRSYWQHGRRQRPHHQGQPLGQWQDRNFREGEPRDPTRGPHHHRGYRGRGRGSGSHQSHGSSGGGAGGGGPHRGAPRDSHQEENGDRTGDNCALTKVKGRNTHTERCSSLLTFYQTCIQ